MSQDGRLKWIQANNTRRNRTRLVGGMIERLVKQAAGAGAEEVSRVAAVVADLVDDDFRRCCRLVLGEEGVVVINVDHPALVQPIRQRWLVPLREALLGRRTPARVRRIVFAYGEVGVMLGGQESAHRQ